MVSHTAFHPEAVFVERAPEQFPALPYAFVHQPGISQNPSDRNVAFVYAGTRIAVIGLVKLVLSNGAPEEVVLNMRLHVRPGLVGKPLQLAAIIN